MKTIAFCFDEDMLTRVDRPTSSSNRSQVIRQALREYVTRVEDLAGEEREREVFRRNRRRLEREAVALVSEQGRP